MASTGTILQVIGSTFDAQFPESDLPEIYNAIDVELEAEAVGFGHLAEANASASKDADPRDSTEDPPNPGP